MFSDPTRLLDALTNAIVERTAIDRILNLGPGLEDPIEEVLALFPSAALRAVDQDVDVCRRLQDQFRANNRVRISHAEASDALTEADATYDLIILRHPNISENKTSWFGALRLVPQALKAEGHFVVTLYDLAELDLLQEATAHSPLREKPGAPYTQVPIALRGQDRYIQIYVTLKDADE
ncbi:MAG: class I SAM-dependent methyltransferase [Chloroflexi bacterium]|nr:class I SAM-dependent methyltransferase [Chloroflexota bacterium]